VSVLSTEELLEKIKVIINEKTYWARNHWESI
jgi:hypothetical protein